MSNNLCIECDVAIDFDTAGWEHVGAYGTYLCVACAGRRGRHLADYLHALQAELDAAITIKSVRCGVALTADEFICSACNRIVAADAWDLNPRYIIASHHADAICCSLACALYEEAVA